jgi:hypothetical protein
LFHSAHISSITWVLFGVMVIKKLRSKFWFSLFISFHKKKESIQGCLRKCRCNSKKYSFVPFFGILINLEIGWGLNTKLLCYLSFSYLIPITIILNKGYRMFNMKKVLRSHNFILFKQCIVSILILFFTSSKVSIFYNTFWMRKMSKIQ